MHIPDLVHWLCGVNVHGNNFNQIRAATVCNLLGGPVAMSKFLIYFTKTSAWQNAFLSSRFSKHF